MDEVIVYHVMNEAGINPILGNRLKLITHVKTYVIINRYSREKQYTMSLPSLIEKNIQLYFLI